MKNILSMIVASIALAFTASAQIPGTPEINPPDSLPIGKMGVLKQLASAESFFVQCHVDDDEVFYLDKNLAEVNSIDDVKTAIDAVRVGFAVEDPTAEIELRAVVRDSNNQPLFEASSWINLEKYYEVGGGVKYRVPYWAGSLYFWSSNLNVSFPGVMAASMIDQEGNEYELEIWNGQIEFGWQIDNGFLKVVTRAGVYFYDFNTGEKINRVGSVVKPMSDFEDFMAIDLVGPLNQTLYPEYGYCPWLQVKVPADGKIKIGRVHSGNNWAPIGVWVSTLKQVNENTCPPPLRYYDGMTIDAESGTTVFIWFDFAPWVWNQNINGGKG